MMMSVAEGRKEGKDQEYHYSSPFIKTSKSYYPFLLHVICNLITHLLILIPSSASQIQECSRKKRRKTTRQREKCYEERNPIMMIKTLVFIMLILIPSPSNGIPSSSSRRVVAAIPGDLVVGALFPVHHAPILKHAHTRQCTEIREQYGIQRIEASFFTIDTINSDDSILPNITLGLEIRDSCWYSPIALEQSIEFIRDAMAAGEDQVFYSSPAAYLSSQLTQDQIKLRNFGEMMIGNRSFRGVADPFLRSYASSRPRQLEGDDGDLMSDPSFPPGLGPLDPFWLIRNSIKNTTGSSGGSSSVLEGQGSSSVPVPGMCPKQGKKVKNIVGVIGPASSSVTIQVQNLLQLFNIPQIGYSATSRDLSVKSYYKYFLRVVPSDLLQARVMVDLMRTYNWTYISAVYTDGNYGSSLMEVFKNLAHEAGICIANTETVFNNAEDEMFDTILKTLLQYKSTARVVACFCEGMTVRGLLKSMRRLNVAGELLLIGSDGWSDRYDVIEGYEVEAVGGISVRIYSPYVTEFDPYYFSLHPDNNTRNPWFREFWEHRFNCTLPPLVSSFPPSTMTNESISGGSVNQQGGYSSFHTFSSKGRQSNICSGNERLNDSKYKQDTKMAFVMKSIWTMAYGLHNMQRDLCPHTSGLCSNMLPVDGSLFLQYLMNVTFKWGNETVSFDEYGDPPGRYDIMNLQQVSQFGYEYVHVGSWVSLTGSNHENGDNDFQVFRPFQWPVKSLTTNSSSPIPESVCSKPCPKGQAKNIQSDSVKCCWVCVPCQRNQYLKDEYTCVDCDLGWWPNDDLTSGCFQIDVKYIQWTETASLIAIGIALLGIIATIFTMVIFIRHNNTPVVKASTRELSYMIMIGMILAHSTTFFLLMKPTQEVCFITRVLPGFSFAVIYASLVTKTNRIARILAGSKKRIMTKKLRFMSSFAQVIISLIIITVEVAILTGVMIIEPADSKLDYPSLDQVVLICNTSTLAIIAPLGFDFFLILMCTVYAVKTRNVPENFNEAKFIGFTMYTTLVIWIAFIPLYFGSQLKVLTMCLAISFSAIVSLVLLYFPKCYIMIFKPEKNNRSFFTTAKNVRCHIGYVPTVGISRYSSRSASDNAATGNTTAVTTTDPASKDKDIDHHHIQARNSSSEVRGSIGKTMNIFERLRSNKQEKIAAVQRKIIAVRAAEDLDRRTNAKRSAGRGFSSGANFNPRNYSNEGNDGEGGGGGKGRPSLIEETTEGSIRSPKEGSIQQYEVKSLSTSQSVLLDPPRKMRMISLLKSTFGEDDLIKIPGFSEFESATRQELIEFNISGTHSNLRRMRSLHVDASTQTSLDLLDTFLRSSPRYSSSKIVSSLNGLNSTDSNSAAQGPLPSSSPFILGSNNLSSGGGGGNNHQRIWESSQLLNGRQAWLVGQSSGSNSITGPIMVTAPIHLQGHGGRNVAMRGPLSHASSSTVQGLITNYLPSSSGDGGVSSTFVSETREGMDLETTLSPSGLRMRQQRVGGEGGGGIHEQPGNWSGNNKSHNILSAPLPLPSIPFSTPHLPPPSSSSHLGHYNIMSSQHQTLLSNLRTTSSGLPEPLPPPIDFNPVHGTNFPSFSSSLLPHQVEQMLDNQQRIQQQLQRTRSRGSTTSTNQRSSEESLHVTGVSGGITPARGSVVEESASSGGDSSPSSSGAVYKNIIITLASSRIPSGHLREDDEDDDRERMTTGSFDDGDDDDEEDDEDLSLGPGLEHHHREPPPVVAATDTTTLRHSHPSHRHHHPNHLQR